MSDRSLSNPTVVGDLVASFCHDVKDLLDQCVAGDLDDEELAPKVKARCRRLSNLFSGKTAGWDITTWHTARLNGLPSRARAILASMKANYGTDANFDPDQPVAGLFYLLSMHCISAYKHAHGSDNPPDNHQLSDAMRYIIGVLVGTPKQNRA